MLVIGRRENERIHIADNIVVSVIRIDGQTVRLAIDAPRHIPIRRDEIEPVEPPRKQPNARVKRRARTSLVSA